MAEAKVRPTWLTPLAHSQIQGKILECPVCGGEHLYTAPERLEAGLEFEVQCRKEVVDAYRKVQRAGAGDGAFDAAVADLDTFTVKVKG